MRKKKKKTIVDLKIEALDAAVKGAEDCKERFYQWVEGKISDKVFAYMFMVDINHVRALCEILKKRSIKEEKEKK